MNTNELVSVAPIYGDYLAHHGIKGQRWGVRRFQNPDGSLKDSAKRRYGRLKDITLSRNETRYKNKAKANLKGAAAAIGTAAIVGVGGALLVKSLSDKGRNYLAKEIFSMAQINVLGLEVGAASGLVAAGHSYLKSKTFKDFKEARTDSQNRKNRDNIGE